MSGFLEALVRRGAGLVPLAGQQLLGLRPRSRFEPLSSDSFHEPNALAELEVSVPPQERTADHRLRAHNLIVKQDAAERSNQIPSTRPDGAGSGAPQRRVSTAGLRDPGVLPVAGGTTPSPQGSLTPAADLSSAMRDPVESGSAPEVATTVVAKRAAAPIEDQPAITSDDRDPADKRPLTSMRRIEGDAVAPSSLRPPTSRMPADAVLPRTAMETARTADWRSAKSELIGPSPTHPGIHDIGQTAEKALQLTISIGRIEIDFGQRPAAPARSPAPRRTRGFEAYARARRGQLR